MVLRKNIFLNSKRLVILAFLISILSLNGCLGGGSGSRKTQKKYPNEVTQQMEAAFNQADSEFRAKRYDAAEMKYLNYIDQFPYNALTDQAQFRRGQIRLIRDDYNAAIQLFEGIIKKTPDPQMASRARVKAGISYQAIKQSDLALSHFKKIDANYLLEFDRLSVAPLALKLMQSTESYEDKAYYYVILLDEYQSKDFEALKKKYSDTLPNPESVRQFLEIWSRQSVSLTQVDSRLEEYKSNASSPYIFYKLGQASLVSKKDSQANKYFTQLVNRYPQSSLAPLAQEALKNVKSKGDSKIKKYRIGVILPMSGKYQSYGESAWQGIQCAAGLQPGCVGAQNLELILKDDGGQPDKAVLAVEELVNQENVVAIIGPLSSASAMAAAAKAQELGVVMVSLAQKEGIPGVGNHIYRFSLTPDQQIKSLLNSLVQKKKQNLVAVLHPKSNYGKVFADKFKSAASAYNVEVVSMSSYQNPKDAVEAIRALKLKVSKTSQKAPMGFEAIFIPDSYLSVLYLLPQMQMLGMDKLTLMGTNAWNDVRLASLSKGLLQNGLFLDMYFIGAKDPLVKKFNENFRTAFQKEPSTLSAMGYDVALFIARALSEKPVKGREAFLTSIESVKNFHGVAGLKSFGSDREAVLEPFMLTVKGEDIIEYDN